MMKERPVLMRAPMVRALLNGTKTQTRRVAKPVKHHDLGNLYTHGALVLEHEPSHVIERACPYGRLGDKLWVRETFYCDSAFYPDGVGVNCRWREVDGERVPIPVDEQRVEMLESMYYRANGEPEWEGAEGPTPWRPSIHMPRWASRITLEITEVRVQRLQDISEEDARAEGVERFLDTFYSGLEPRGKNAHASARGAYGSLWEHINGAGSWDANPWVWAISFLRITS
jgi:hypothetical protein